jgi:hypothetical protein
LINNRDFLSSAGSVAGAAEKRPRCGEESGFLEKSQCFIHEKRLRLLTLLDIGAIYLSTLR